MEFRPHLRDDPGMEGHAGFVQSVADDLVVWSNGFPSERHAEVPVDNDVDWNATLGFGRRRLLGPICQAGHRLPRKRWPFDFRVNGAPQINV